VSESAFAATPYKGLMPYSEEDAPFFFGREAEREIIIANLMASRLTLFYGPSGVGKSSVLRAGVAYHLRRLARENLDETGSPGFAVVVFNSWRDDPVAGLEARVRDSALQSLDGQTVEPVPASRSLSETFKAWTQRLGGELLVILDQFEEYFLYHGQEDGAESFAIQLPRMVNSPELNVNFLISIRDDGLAKLDRFQGRIPTLFDNRLGIDHLDRDAARDAITQPIEQFNRLYAAGRQRVSIEPELVEAVLDQVKTGQVTVGEAGRGVIKREAAKAQIETPYLQLVMNRLWDEDVRPGSRVLRLKTLETLGGARRIVRTHLDAAMKALTRHEQDVAAHVFHYLVTPSGAKIAHTIPDLASYSELSKKELLPVMERLSAADVRILRGVAPPPDTSDEPRYEIFHDVLAAAILDWRQRYVQAQQEQRSLRSRYRSVAAVALLILVLAGGIIAWLQWRNSQELSKVEQIAEKESEQNDKLNAVVEAQAENQQSLRVLADLNSDDPQRQSEAIVSVKQLASEGKLTSDLLPTIKETIKRKAPTDATATLNFIDSAVEAARSKPTDDTKLPPRVYIHIRDNQQRDIATQIKKGLQNAGYVVPGIQLVSDTQVGNQLRYFRDEDQADAYNIINSLGDLKLANVVAVRVKGYEKSTLIRSRHFELWFGGQKKEPPRETQNQTEEQTGVTKPELFALRIEVFDSEKGYAVVGAAVNVRLRSGAGPKTTTVETDSKGVAIIKGVSPGLVSIKVTAKGFATYSQDSKFDPQSLYAQNQADRVRIGLKRQANAR
jgi:hypothetical protein